MKRLSLPRVFALMGFVAMTAAAARPAGQDSGREDAMHETGGGGALMMGVGLRTPPGSADFNSTLWRELYAHAATEAARLGMRLTLHQSDGWGSAGDGRVRGRGFGKWLRGAVWDLTRLLWVRGVSCEDSHETTHPCSERSQQINKHRLMR